MSRELWVVEFKFTDDPSDEWECDGLSLSTDEFEDPIDGDIASSFESADHAAKWRTMIANMGGFDARVVRYVPAEDAR